VPPDLSVGRICFRTPIPAITVAANYLDEAVSAHTAKRPERAEELIKLANMPVIEEWGESLWGKASPYIQYRRVADAPPTFALAQRERLRMPTSAERHALHLRDGYHCRFCAIPLIRREVRDQFRKLYPLAVSWGRTAKTQHAAFLTMWAQYDHILPHSRGGNNDLENLIVTCAPCNFGRMSYTLDEVGLADPRKREPVHSNWDGLERLLRPVRN